MRCLKLLLSVFLILHTSKTAVRATNKFESTLRGQASTIVDNIIEGYKHKVIASGNSRGEIKLEDIHTGIGLPLFTKVVNVLAANGRLGNVLTVYRKGPVELEFTENPRRVALRSTLALDLINIHFEKFNVDFPFIHQRATMQVEVRDPEIYAEIVVVEYPCTAFLKEMRIVSYGKVVPHVRGMSWGILNSVAEKILKTFISIVSTLSKSTLQAYVYKLVKEGVEFVDICGTMFV